MDKHLINEIVDKVVREKIFEILMLEYAVDKKSYINRVWNLSPILISHWCLIKFHRLSNDGEIYIPHWKRELFGWMESLSLMNLKGKNNAENKYNALYQAFDSMDYTSNLDVIKNAIRKKFQDENVDIQSPLIDEVATAFIVDLENIMHFIACGDINTIRDYVNSL